MNPASPVTTIVSSATALKILQADLAAVGRVVADAYLAQLAGRVINPASATVHLSEQVADRGIALPAFIRGDGAAASIFGMKWITSRVDNPSKGFKRAHGVVILSSPETGVPFAIVEASAISAFRTAASAALAARLLGATMADLHLGVVGAGYIGATTTAFLAAFGADIRSISIFDKSDQATRRFQDHIASIVRLNNVSFSVSASPQTVVRQNQLTIFSTTSSKPYFDDRSAVEHHPIILHLSLRDLAPELLCDCENFVDDHEEATRAGTALGEAVSLRGASVVGGSIGQLLDGQVACNNNRCRVFSPYGMGMLDIALGHYVYEQASLLEEAPCYKDFYSN